jgi:hypothetical protein
VRHRPPPPGVVPPAELRDFALWARGRGLPYQYDGSSRAARSFDEWERARAAWAATHPDSEDGLGGLPDAPWDPHGI